MIGYAMEAPTRYLETFTSVTDLDFCLAHKVLEDRAYAEHFLKRDVRRDCILDNSFHELRHALPVSDLHEAAKRVLATYVIAPDNEHDPDWSLEQYRMTIRTIGPSYMIGAVLIGESVQVRERLLLGYRNADLLCLPFRWPRLEWYKEVPKHFERIHLLGLSSLAEIKEWNAIAKRETAKHFTMDTAKPLKAGIVGRRIDDGLSLRKIPVSSKDLLNIPSLSEDQIALIKENVSLLKELLA